MISPSPDVSSYHSGTGVGPAASVLPFAQAWSRHSYILPSFVISLVVCAWFVTWGDWAFFERESFCAYYDAQARSIIEGHLDVPREAIGFEAYTFQNRTYGYFGIGPALLRVPLVIIFGDLNGLSSRAMMMMACTASLLCTYGILRLIRGTTTTRGRSRRLLDSIFVVCAGIGSTNIFMMSRSFVFHEAIMWGSTFALLCAWTIMKYLKSPSRRLLALAGIFSCMALNCRPTAGAGALLMIGAVTGILAWRSIAKGEGRSSWIGFGNVAKPIPHILIGVAAMCVTLGVYFGVNYAKFQTFDGVPVRYYDLYRQIPSRMEVTGGKQIHPENIPTTAATYFGIRGASFEKDFPWVFLSRTPTRIGSPAIDVVEGFSTFPISMPALTLLALGGGVALVLGSTEPIRRARLHAFTLLIGGGIILMTVGITERYLHDLYPSLIICAAAGVARFDNGGYLRQKAAIVTILGIISIAVNCAFALVHQRAAPWGVPAAKRAEFIYIQRLFGRSLL